MATWCVAVTAFAYSKVCYVPPLTLLGTLFGWFAVSRQRICRPSATWAAIINGATFIGSAILLAIISLSDDI